MLVAVNVSLGTALYFSDDGPEKFTYDNAFNACLDYAQEGNGPYEVFRKYADRLSAYELREERIIPARMEEAAMDGCVAGVMVIHPGHEMYDWERPW